MQAQPLFIMIKYFKSLKLVKLLQVWKKSDSGECIEHASVTLRNKEYTKYDPPGAQVFDDALAQKYLLYTPPSRLKRKI